MQRFVCGLVTLLWAAGIAAMAQPQPVHVGTSYGVVVIPAFLPPAMDPSDPAAYWANSLGLDTGQQAGVKAILADRRNSAEAARAGLEQARAALEAAAKQNSADAEIDGLSANLANALAQAVTAEAKAYAKFYALLTPEQKQKLDKMTALPPGASLAVSGAVSGAVAAGGTAKQ